MIIKDTDEVFLIVKGTQRSTLWDGAAHLPEREMNVVPKGVERRALR